MGLNDDYVIISTEKANELPDDSIVLFDVSHVTRFYVVKKSEVPRTRLQPLDDKKLTPIIDGGAISSNIEEFQACNSPIFELILGAKFCFSVPNGFSGYVRLTIDDTYEAQDVTITPKKTFEDLFGGKEK